MTKSSILHLFFFHLLCSEMYILVEKDLATRKKGTEKNPKQKNITWKTYGLVNICLLYLNECTSFCWLSYKEENTWRVDFALLCCQRRKPMKRTKIRNPRVYTYRATSVMLTSLSVSFWKLLWTSVATLFQLNTVSSSGAQFPDSVRRGRGEKL